MRRSALAILHFVAAAICLSPVLFLAAMSVASRWAYPDVLPRGFVLNRWSALVVADSALRSSLLLSMAISTGDERRHGHACASRVAGNSRHAGVSVA